ncbi:MAG: DUF3811 domain-containing protein [Enterobacterales bacterium]|jgi:hypothetical protein|uniref:YjbD family (DUF3811) n=1 Tax=Obesumbacterium proteus ATCC 12841 TaxID=1354268 RepID=A0AA91INF9_9GAMM|nr:MULTISPECIES: DUF3811 domain-containing protein [Hafniaceae]MDN5970528.1 DUF3811 domain-containing protein [Enterobacterales bacterium]MDN5988220.1 DUF3811 domain-containing protein [Hafniaceae bacterium]AMO82551.1 hypothetical protein DSM2777_16825 [Obesumbacterium proteus]AWV44890.1 hypothetical protein CD201_10130 [Hafnia alvei]KKI43099.1 hypothetical protein XK97_17370 [Obesumbacterium proteus]
MKKLTLKDLNESQLQRVQVRQAQARKSLDRPLTNAEKGKIKDEMLKEIALEMDKEAKKVRAEKKKQKVVPSDETFSWSKNNHTRGLR